MLRWHVHQAAGRDLLAGTLSTGALPRKDHVHVVLAMWCLASRRCLRPACRRRLTATRREALRRTTDLLPRGGHGAAQGIRSFVGLPSTRVAPRQVTATSLAAGASRRGRPGTVDLGCGSATGACRRVGSRFPVLVRLGSDHGVAEVYEGAAIPRVQCLRRATPGRIPVSHKRIPHRD